MAGAAVAEKFPEILKEGLAVYKELKNDMSEMLGLKAYAEHMQNIVQTMKQINKYLDEEDKTASEKLETAAQLAKSAMQKAQLVIETIKAQAQGLVCVLDGQDTEGSKMKDACVLFAQFAKDIKPHIEDAREDLLAASNSLGVAKSTVDSIVRGLKRVQDNIVNEKKAAQANQRYAAYGGAAAGLIAGPMGLIISYSIAAGVCEGLNIPAIEEDFSNQRKTIQGYVGGFEKMGTVAGQLQKRVDDKSIQLTKIRGQMSAAESMSSVACSSSMFSAVATEARSLVALCNTP